MSSLEPRLRTVLALCASIAGVTLFWMWPDHAPPEPAPSTRVEARSVEVRPPAELPFRLHDHDEADEARARLPAPLVVRYHRAPDEWQGMQSDPGDVWPCVDGMCTQARACIDGACLPCAADSECMGAELCVLGLCVLEGQADCQSRADCDEENALCVLSGLTSMDPRGNRDMRASCLGPDGGAKPSPEQVAREVAALHAQARPNPREDGPTPGARALDLLRRAQAEGRP